MALGLACNLNPSAAGGVERLKGHQNLVEASAPQAPSVPYTPSEIPRGYGRIIRDESGNVLGIEMSETDTTNSQNSDQGQRDLNPPIDEMLLARWAVNLGGGATKSVPSERQDTFLRGKFSLQLFSVLNPSFVPRSFPMKFNDMVAARESFKEFSLWCHRVSSSPVRNAIRTGFCHCPVVSTWTSFIHH